MKPAMIQTNGSYAMILEFVSGLVEAPFLDAINSIVKEEGARIHLTTSQKIMLLDLSKKSAKRAKERLDALHPVRVQSLIRGKSKAVIKMA